MKYAPSPYLFWPVLTCPSLAAFTCPLTSETARRNSNLFVSAVRAIVDSIPYAEHLIHRTEQGHMVRSKSELVIANKLFQTGGTYEYERLYQGIKAPGTALPDFSFVDPSGELILWEHIGMLARDNYRRSWEWKRDWYERSGFELGRNLFTTQDDEKGGLDSAPIKEMADNIKKLL
jgi:hypothetical protein